MFIKCIHKQILFASRWSCFCTTHIVSASSSPCACTNEMYVHRLRPVHAQAHSLRIRMLEFVHTGTSLASSTVKLTHKAQCACTIIVRLLHAHAVPDILNIFLSKPSVCINIGLCLRMHVSCTPSTNLRIQTSSNTIANTRINARALMRIRNNTCK